MYMHLAEVVTKICCKLESVIFVDPTLMPTDCFITWISSPDMLTLLDCSVLKLTRFIRLNLKLGIRESIAIVMIAETYWSF